MEVVVTTEAIRLAKLQSNHHHQQTNTKLFTGRMTFLSPNQQRRSTEGRKHNLGMTDREIDRQTDRQTDRPGLSEHTVIGQLDTSRK